MRAEGLLWAQDPVSAPVPRLLFPKWGSANTPRASDKWGQEGSSVGRLRSFLTCPCHLQGEGCATQDSVRAFVPDPEQGHPWACFPVRTPGPGLPQDPDTSTRVPNPPSVSRPQSHFPTASIPHCVPKPFLRRLQSTSKGHLRPSPTSFPPSPTDCPSSGRYLGTSLSHGA